MDSNKNCGKSSATKKLKGFTVVELLIVMAILAIFAGMISIITSGLVRDARLETARDKAQTVYTALQNAVIQMEIKQEGDLLDPTSYTSGGGTFSKYTTLGLVIDQGNISSSNALVMEDGTNNPFLIQFNYPSDSDPTTEDEKKIRKLAKYITDNLAMDFTGYIYAAIDMEDWVVDSVVFVEDYEKVQSSPNGIEDFVPMFKTKSSGSTNIMTASNGRIPFCKNIYDQKKIYSGKTPSNGDFLPNAVGMSIGYYPLYDDISNSTTVSYS